MGLAAFLFAFVGVAAVSIGGRDQLLVARIAGRPGALGPVLLVGALTAIISAFAMAAVARILGQMLAPAAARMLIAFALAFAAVELAWARAPRLPHEPTRSLVATFIVLLARQWGDAARFLVLAIAAGGSAWLAGAGGALGGIAALAGAAVAGEPALSRLRLRAIRLTLAAILLLLGIWNALHARGIIG